MKCPHCGKEFGTGRKLDEEAAQIKERYWKDRQTTAQMANYEGCGGDGRRGVPLTTIAALAREYGVGVAVIRRVVGWPDGK